jgi:hypothetical protein
MFEGSKALPACPSDNSSINMKMSKEHWWNDTERERQKYRERKPVPVSLYPPQIPHVLTWDRILASAVADRPIAARTMAVSFSASYRGRKSKHADITSVLRAYYYHHVR